MKKVLICAIAVVAIILVSIAAVFAYNYFTEEPVLTLKGEEEITLSTNTEYNDEGIEANYHKKDISGDVTKTGKVDISTPGTYTITYQYNYGKDKVKEIKRIVHIEDKEPPVLTLKGKTEMTIYTDETYKEPGYTAQDNVDNNLDKQVKVEKKQINSMKYQLIYTVTDTSGNVSSATRNINLKKRVIKPVTNTSNGNSNSQGKNQDSNQTTSSGPNSGIIYLTFDDGPSLDITPKILDILKSENVKATFFIINYTANKEYLVKREASEGHSIGIHGYSHDYNAIYKSVDTYMENVTKLQSKIKATTGITTYITRFPGGSSNTVSSFNPKIMTKLTKEVVNRGYKYYDWNVSSGDAGGAKNKDQVYNNVTKNLVKNRSNVVLMHDFSNNTKTLNALTAIIQFGKKNGYTFKAITKDTPMVTHHVNN